MSNKEIIINYKGWWDSLTLEQKHFYKNLFLEIRKWNLTQRNPFPDMYNITDIRVNKLSDKQVYRIWVFRNYYKKPDGSYERDWTKGYP
jgi:hypothetical protein